MPADRKEAAREGLVKIGREVDLGGTALWTRVNSLDSPWVLDDLTAARRRDRRPARRDHGPQGRGRRGTSTTSTGCWRSSRRGTRSRRPILVHAILETALGVANVEEIAAASPRMQGMSFGPADLAASRRMKTTRVGGGHPGYVVLADPDPRAAGRAARQRAAGSLALLDRAHGRRLRGDRHPPLLRAVRRHRRRRRLRGAVPRGVPDGLRRRLVAAPAPDRDRQARLLARSRGGALRASR